MIRFACECGQQLQVRPEHAGLAVLCPACKRQLTVPAGDVEAIQVVEEAVQPVAPRRPPRLTREDDFEEEPRPAGPTGTSGKAITSLVLGVLSLFCNVFTGIPAVILGIIALKDIGNSRERLTGRGLAITGIVAACLGIPLSCVVGLFPATSRVREAAARTQSANNLKQMGLAMHNYSGTYNGTFPAAGFASADPLGFRPLPPGSKPLLSWRVAILPFIEQDMLYRQFKLDEPWDGPNNIKLLPLMPKTYKLPGDDKTPSDHTHYLVFVGNGGAFEKDRGVSMPAEFIHGTSNTILIVEADKAVPWTKPDDIAYDPSRPILPLMSKHFRNGFNVLLADGSVRFLYHDMSEKTLKWAIDRNNQDATPSGW